VPPFFRQGLVASCLLLCEYERGLAPIQLCLIGADLCLLDGHLCVDVLHVHLRLLHPRLGLTDCDPVVGRVDLHQQITLVNISVVDCGQLDDTPRHFRRHRDDIGAHGGVTRPRRLHTDAPHRPTEKPGQRDRRQGDQELDCLRATPCGWAGFLHKRQGGVAIIVRVAALRCDFSNGHG
jgi:hypothetical protein